MQALTFNWAMLSTLSAPVCNSDQSDVLVGLWKCNVLYVGMLDVSPLVSILFHQP